MYKAINMYLEFAKCIQPFVFAHTLRKGQLNRHTRYHTFRVVTYVFTCNSKFTPHFRRALFYLESDVVGKSAATLAACTAGLPRSVG